LRQYSLGFAQKVPILQNIVPKICHCDTNGGYHPSDTHWNDQGVRIAVAQTGRGLEAIRGRANEVRYDAVASNLRQVYVGHVTISSVASEQNVQFEN